MEIKQWVVVTLLVAAIAYLGVPYFRSALSDKEQVVIEFERWLKEVKIITKGVEVQKAASGLRGLYATEDIRPGTLVADIPISATIPDNLETDDPIIKEAQEKLTDNKLLAVIVYREMNKNNSRFSPYLNLMPTNFSTFPLFYGPKVLNRINNTISKEIIENFVGSIQRTYTEVIKAVPDLNFTREEYYEYFTHASSRCLVLFIDGRRTYTLVPVFDMMNAFPPSRPDLRTVTVRLDTTNGPRVHVRTTRNLWAGEELYNMYDPRFTNTDYLLHYGFVYPDLDTLTLQVKFDYLDGEPDKEQKIQMLRQIDFVYPSENKVVITIKNSGNRTHYRSMYSAVRIINCQAEEQLATAKKMLDDSKVKQLPFLDDANEREAMLDIIEFCDEKLKGIASTAEQDELLLNFFTPFTTEYNLLKLRKDERRVLREMRVEAYNTYKNLGNAK